jgi:hypothetical protein
MFSEKKKTFPGKKGTFLVCLPSQGNHHKASLVYLDQIAQQRNLGPDWDGSGNQA